MLPFSVIHVQAINTSEINLQMSNFFSLQYLIIRFDKALRSDLGYSQTFGPEEYFPSLMLGSPHVGLVIFICFFVDFIFSLEGAVDFSYTSGNLASLSNAGSSPCWAGDARQGGSKPSAAQSSATLQKL